MNRKPDEPERVTTIITSPMYRQEACVDCAVNKRSGGLPCHWRVELDILTMNADSPSIMIKSCPHYKPVYDPSDLVEWIQ